MKLGLSPLNQQRVLKGLKKHLFRPTQQTQDEKNLELLGQEEALAAPKGRGSGLQCRAN